MNSVNLFITSIYIEQNDRCKISDFVIYFWNKLLLFSILFSKKITSFLSDKEIMSVVLSIEKGDKDAFALFYDYYWKKVYHFMSLYIRNESEIEDLIQDVFIKVWENRAELDSGKDPSNYLFILSRNTILNYLRKKNNSRKYTQIILDGIEDYTKHNIDNYVEVKELECELLRLIDQLPSRQKEVFTLSRHKNYTQVQIAEEMKISIKTVENHMTRALAFLKDKLQI